MTLKDGLGVSIVIGLRIEYVRKTFALYSEVACGLSIEDKIKHKRKKHRAHDCQGGRSDHDRASDAPRKRATRDPSDPIAALGYCIEVRLALMQRVQTTRT